MSSYRAESAPHPSPSPTSTRIAFSTPLPCARWDAFGLKYNDDEKVSLQKLFFSLFSLLINKFTIIKTPITNYIKKSATNLNSLWRSKSYSSMKSTWWVNLCPFLSPWIYKRLLLHNHMCIDNINSFISFNFGTFFNEEFHCGYKNLTIMGVTNLTHVTKMKLRTNQVKYFISP